MSILRNVEEIRFNGHFGYPGEADPKEIHPDILVKIVVLEISPEEVIFYLANHVFKDCEAIALL